MLQVKFTKKQIIMSALIIICTLFVGKSFAHEEETISVHVNDEEIVFISQPPYINDNERVMVPLDFLYDVLEAEIIMVDENDKNDENETQVEVIRGENELIFESGKDSFLHNGEIVELNYEVKLLGVRDTTLPLRPVIEKLGGEINWSQEDRSIKITDERINEIDDRFTTSPKVEKVLDIISRYNYLEKDLVEKLVNQAEKKNIDISLLLGLIRVESNFDPNNVGSHAGALGLFQIMPGTARNIAAEHGLEYSQDKLYDPEYNMKLGTKYLRGYLDKYGGDTHKALTAYNRGSVGLQNYINTHGTAVSSFSNKVLEKANKFENELN